MGDEHPRFACLALLLGAQQLIIGDDAGELHVMTYTCWDALPNAWKGLRVLTTRRRRVSIPIVEKLRALEWEAVGRAHGAPRPRWDIEEIKPVPCNAFGLPFLRFECAYGPRTKTWVVRK